mmetsp:Transcript_46635/g.77127  ORF Transcript_46635/g.77127 Transcript_46635/m.77127 type:complete len:211 (+) Transcript_46635:99-731(+)
MRAKLVRAPRRGISASLGAESWAFEPSVWPTVLTLAAIGANHLHQQRPRGWLNPEVVCSLEVRRSNVPGAGRGVFSVTSILPGVVIGTYPGRLITQSAYRIKLSRVPSASSFCWNLQDGVHVLDPTDQAGVLCEPLPLWEPTGGVPLLNNLGSKPTTLALINEPGPRGDVNCRVEEEGADVYFLTERGISAGEELYLDYGQNYDRSSYGN